MIKNSGFWVNIRPDFDPEGSGSGRVGFDLPRVGFFRLGSPMVAKWSVGSGLKFSSFLTSLVYTDGPPTLHVARG